MKTLFFAVVQFVILYYLVQNSEMIIGIFENTFIFYKENMYMLRSMIVQV